ncbi:hypothetical protein KSS87_013134, partial [Heliosperma pusillum]
LLQSAHSYITTIINLSKSLVCSFLLLPLSSPSSLCLLNPDLTSP